MNLCDANVWLALALSRHVHHQTARRWFQAVAEPRSILFCRATQQTLLRLLTNSSVLVPYGNRPLTNAQAWKAYEAFATDDRVALRIDEPIHLESHWKRFAVRDTASPKLWRDAYLAAFAIAADLRLVTTDIAFQQFAGLDPLVLR
jgi:toxin-antitoxin system PIN domain toxin